MPTPQLDRFEELVAWTATNGTILPWSPSTSGNSDQDGPVFTFSFDDGFKSNVAAARVLAKYGASGMFFVPTDHVGVTDLSAARRFFALKPGNQPYVEPGMTWDDLERLLESGHEVGSHTVSHPNLAIISADRIAHELGESRDVLTRRLGSCDHFAWPFGRAEHVNADALRIAHEVGYKSVASAIRGAHPLGATSEDVRCWLRDKIDTSEPLAISRFFISRSARRIHDLTVAAHDRGPAHG